MNYIFNLYPKASSLKTLITYPKKLVKWKNKGKQFAPGEIVTHAPTLIRETPGKLSWCKCRNSGRIRLKAVDDVNGGRRKWRPLN